MWARLKEAMGRRLPWWLVVVVGVACVALGGVLVADPFRSLTVLAVLVGAALVVAEAGELAGAGSASRPWLARLAGGAWLAGGVLALARHDATIGALALAAGVALVVGGALKLLAALAGAGDERLLQGLAGATTVVVGILALAWPDATVLALAVLFGLGVVVFGFGQIATGLKLRGGATEPWAEERRWPRSVRIAGAAIALVLALGGMGISVAIERAQPAQPGAFYAAPSPLPEGPPGTIVRSEVVEDYYPGATTYRVLYKSTGYDGEPTAVSGLVLVPGGDPPPGGRRVIAYTHGTVGVASPCAPSLQPAATHPLFVEGGPELLAAGYVIAASDYQGLGTPGPHPYLLGEPTAMDALDAVRAARNLPEADASADFAVWGHSQGGHAALFTGQLAPTYAPELRLAGVAAGGPVPDLVDLFKVNVETTVGKILIAMALRSWERVYGDASLGQIATPAARSAIARIARTCLYTERQLLASVPSALLLAVTFLHSPPWETEPWRSIAEENTPGAARIPAPVLVVQGDADEIVEVGVTERLVRRLCAEGDTVDLELYPGVGHLATSRVAVPDVVAWLADRFAGRPAPTACG